MRGSIIQIKIQDIFLPFSDEPQPLIKANVNQMYEQRSLNQNIVKLKVGGQATVFKGTKLKIRCPVKKFKRSLIQWAKGDKKIYIILEKKIPWN